MFSLLSRGAAILALVLTASDAQSQMRLSENGRGEVLLFPFYSAASGEETSFVIQNHESHAKALYLRFREGLSGAEVLAFNLYLGPNDSFEGAIIKDSNGDGAAIATLDSSCTVPTLGSPNGPFSGITLTQSDGRVFRAQPFVNYQYSSSRSGYPVTEDSNADIRRTLVGSIEVIEMGQWGSAQSSGFSPAAAVAVFEDIETRDCAALVERWSYVNGDPGEWRENRRANAVSWVGGGISGRLSIRTLRGELSYPPLVIENFAREKLAGEYHVSPGEWEGPWPIPSLANGALTVRSPVTGNLVTAASGLDAVATLLATTEVGVGSSAGSPSSDRAVIVSFPTKWHHTNLEFISDAGGVTSVGEPFRVDWDPSTSSACEAVGFAEGSATAGSFPFKAIVSKRLCGAINLLNYPFPTGALASEADWLSMGVSAIGEYPWAMSFADATWDESYADERLINVKGDQAFLGMPAVVMPLAVSVEGNWIKESDVSRRIQVRSNGGATDTSADTGHQEGAVDSSSGDGTGNGGSSSGGFATGTGDSGGNAGTSAGNNAADDAGPQDADSAGSSNGDGTGYVDSSGGGFATGTGNSGSNAGTSVSNDAADDAGQQDASSAGSASGGDAGYVGTSSGGFTTGTGDSGSSAGASGSDAGASSSASGSGHFSKLFLETPKESSVNSGIGSIQGWALDESGSFGSSIDFYIDGQYRGQIALGDTRRDVGSAYPSVKNSGQSGFSAAFNYGELDSGWHELQVAVTDSLGKMLEASANFYVVRFSGKSFLIGDAAPTASSVTSCLMVEAQIRCSGVSVSGVETTLWLEWSSATQNFEISRID